MDKSQLAAAAEAAKNGDKQAFTELYNAYRDKVYFFAKKNVGSDHAAEDVVSETFITAMEKINTLRSGEAFGGWLYSIAYNKCMDQLRSDKRNVHFESEDEQEIIMENASLNEAVMLPEDYAVNEDRKNELKAMIDGLKPDMKSAVIMYYYEQLSIAEIAESLGLNENAAKQKLFQARKKIKASIEKLYKDGSAFVLVPIGSLLDNVIDSAEAAHAAAPIHSVSTFVSAKAAAVSAAAVLAIGTPVIISHYGKKGDVSLKGDTRPAVVSTESADSTTVSVSDSLLSDTDTSVDDTSSLPDTSSLSSSSHSTSSDGVRLYAQTEDSSIIDPDTRLRYTNDTSNASPGAAAGQSSSSSSSSSSSDTDSSSQPQQPDTLSDTDSSESDAPLPTGLITDTSVDEIAGMSPDRFVEFVGGNYEISFDTGYSHSDYVALTSPRLPSYKYIVSYSGVPSDSVDENTENVFTPPAIGAHTFDGFSLILEPHPTIMEIYEGAFLSDYAWIGMTAEELCEGLALDPSYTGSMTPSVLWDDNADFGRGWYSVIWDPSHPQDFCNIYYDMTEEQEQEIERRYYESTGLDHLERNHSVDISNMALRSKKAIVRVTF